jgi:hypothetical protein
MGPPRGRLSQRTGSDGWTRRWQYDARGQKTLYGAECGLAQVLSLAVKLAVKLPKMPESLSAMGVR